MLCLSGWILVMKRNWKWLDGTSYTCVIINNVASWSQQHTLICYQCIHRSLGAIGGLSALGGIAVGSAAFMSGGAVIAVGGVMVLITSKARYSSKSTTAARILLESKVRQLLQEFTQAAPARQQMIQQGFQEAGIKAERMDVDKRYYKKLCSILNLLRTLCLLIPCILVIV